MTDNCDRLRFATFPLIFFSELYTRKRKANNEAMATVESDEHSAYKKRLNTLFGLYNRGRHHGLLAILMSRIMVLIFVLALMTTSK